ncbi:MAG: hypothetical protein WBV82_22135 [Myxococcaceae bacterium]
MNRIAAVSALGLGLVVGCAHTRPDAMSADAHQRESLEHRRQAIEASTQYDPDARSVGFGQDTGDRNLVVYNPTERHLKATETHRAHADAHARAAAALRESEAAACGTIPEEARAACPLLSPHVARVVETLRGIELELKPDAPAQELVSRMRCHLEHSRVEGFPEEDGESCPLYLRGSTIALDGNAIEISGSSPKMAAEIRSDARRLFGQSF